MKTDLFINNEWRPAASGKRFAVENPATEENLADGGGRRRGGRR